MKAKILLSVLAIMLLIGINAQAYTISGNIDGAEWFGGITYIYAVSLDITNPSFSIGLALLGAGPYLILDVAAGDYIIFAYQDRDGDVLPSINDYIGYYGDGFPEILTVSDDVTGLDILVEPIPFTTISGTLTCPEGYSGLTLIYAATDPYFENTTNFSIALSLDGNADYTLFVDPGQYYVRAHLDADINFTPSPADPQFFWGAPGFPTIVDVTEMNAEGIDLPLVAPPDVDVSLEPLGAPIVIPATGGTFEYILSGSNNMNEAVGVHLWQDATMPDGSTTPPVVGPIPMNVPAGFTSERQRIQAVPGNAPAGIYSFNAHVGIYPVIIWDEASFDVEKSAAGSDQYVLNWFNDGDSIANWVDDWNKSTNAEALESYDLVKVYPNPFNPVTVIRYKLQSSNYTTLAVFDVQGRQVSTLVDGYRDAGVHEVMFDASNLPSSVYIYQLTSGQYQTNGKLVLVK